MRKLSLIEKYSLVDSEANARRITSVEDNFGTSGVVSNVNKILQSYQFRLMMKFDNPGRFKNIILYLHFCTNCIFRSPSHMLTGF